MPDHALIELKGISKTYTTKGEENAVAALRNVSLSIKRGDFLAIMGASGSGKSTLMNILGLLDVPSIGEYLLEGKPIQESSGRRLAELRNRYFGFVYQSFNLLKRTSVIKNVELPLIYNRQGAGDRRERTKKALEEVGLSHRLHHKPNQLSGGEQQRVAIARALINNPSIILADEPTGNLDSKTGQQIMQIFTRLHKQGKTIILVTHEKEIAEFAKKLLILKDGEIIEERNLS